MDQVTTPTVPVRVRAPGPVPWRGGVPSAAGTAGGGRLTAAHGHRHRRALGMVGLGAATSLAVLVTASLLGGAADPQPLSDPGAVTRWGVLVARAVNDVAALGTLGVLLVAVVLLPRTPEGFGPDAARVVRAVAPWAGLWAVSAVVTALLTLSSVAGLPVRAALGADVLPLVVELEVTRALLASAWLATLVAVGARLTRSPATGVLLLLTAAGAVVLPLLTGHAGHGEVPALTATSLVLHVVAAAAWVGGLGALVVHLRRSTDALAVALPRFSRLALVCFVAVAVSGALTGWASLTSVTQVWTTAYGQLLLGKVALLVVLGVIGHRHRVGTVAAAVRGRPGAFVRLAAAELVLMGCAAALAVALSHTAPPPADHAPGAATTAVTGR